MEILKKWLGLLLTDEWSTRIIVVNLAVGIGLCQFSFDWQAHQLAHPLMNLAGLLLLIIVPLAIGAIYLACQNWRLRWLRPGKWPGVATSGMCIGYPMVFYYSSGQGYLSADAVVLLLILSICSLGLLAFANRQPVS